MKVRSTPLYLLLICQVIFIFWLQGSRKGDTGSADGEGAPELLLMARHAVGSGQLLAGKALPGAAVASQMFEQIEGMARGDKDQVRMIILAGELLGGEDAVARLDSRASTLPAEGPIADDLATLRMLYSGQREQLEAEARDSLMSRYGWYAQLALSFGLSDQHPDREAAMRPAVRTEIVMLVMVVGFCIALLAGLIFLSLGIYGKLRGDRWGYEDVLEFCPPKDNVFLEVMVIALVIMPITWFGAAVVPPVFAPLVQLSAVIVPFFALKRGVNPGHLNAALGWFPGRGFFKECFAGVAGYLAGIPILCVALLVTLVVTRFTAESPAHPIAGILDKASTLQLVVLFIMPCIIAPIVEETIFRGVFYHHLRGRHGIVFSALFQGVVFATIHPQGLGAIPVLTAMAMVLSFIREWRGSMIAPMVAHGINNTIIFSFMLLVLR